MDPTTIGWLPTRPQNSPNVVVILELFFFREVVSHGIAAHTRSIPALDHGIAAYTCVYATHSGSGNHVHHPHELPPPLREY